MEIYCIDVRRELTTDPRNKDANLLQHLVGCDDCSDFLQRLKSFEDKLGKAVKLDVPEGLESRIILAQRMESSNAENVEQLKSRASYTNNYKWMSIAAALVLAIGLSLGMFKLGESYAVQNEVLAHVYEDLYALEKDNRISLVAFNQRLKPFGVKASESIGHVRYATLCPLDNKKVPHFVLDYEGRPITVMFVPWEKSNKRIEFHDQRFKGLLFGADYGTFVVLTEEQDSDKSQYELNMMQQRLMDAIEVEI